LLESAHDLETPRLREIVEVVELLTGKRAMRIPFPPTLASVLLMIGSRAPSARVRDAALGATIALREVVCEGPNALTRHPSLAVPLAEGLRRELEWLRANGRA